MKKSLVTLSFAATLALAANSHAAVLASVDVWAGSVSGNPPATFTNLGDGGAGPNGTRIGVASAVSATRTAAGTSNEALWTIPGPGVYFLTYHLDNTVNAQFRPGIQGFYDATSGVAGSASAVQTALNDFVSLLGVTATTTPNPPPSSLDTGAGTVGAPAVLFTTEYVIAPGSPAIGMDVAVGFYSNWSGPGGYIFGREDGPNQVTVIPEPSAAFLAFLGFIPLLRRRR